MKGGKPMRKLIGLIVVVVLLAGGGLAGTAEAQFKWKLQSANPAGNPHMDLLARLVSNVDKMSGGRLKIEVLPAGSCGGCLRNTGCCQ